MDIPTYTIFFSLVIFIGIILLLKQIRLPQMQSAKILFLSSLAILLFVIIFGEFIFSWANNVTCSKYLGCVDGFTGYDAFEHLFFGVTGALAIIWLCDYFPKHSVLYPEQWKTVLVVVAIIVLFSVLWEILECSHDSLRMKVLHQNLYNFKLRVVLLNQPTNIDTMGDLIFSLIGAIIGFFIQIRKRDS